MLSIKPENGDGDFDFSRSSAATRVNAQGLVENVQIISPELVSNGNFSQIGTEEVLNGNFSQEGSELITNGDFSNGLTNWYVDDGTSWTNVNNTAFCDGNNGLIAQNHTTTQNKVYKVTFDSVATNSIGKELGVRIAAGTYAWNLYPTGTHTIYLTAGSSNTQGVLFYATSGWTGSIDNVSVKEVGQNWILGSGWSIGDNKAIGSSTTNTIQQLSILQSNKTYKLTYTILDYVSGSIRPNVGTVNGTLQSSNGTFTEYIKSLGSHFYFDGVSAFTGSITNISVKEVGQDWTLGTGWSVDQANSKAIGDGTSFTYITQTPISIQNKKVKLTFDILDYVSGTFRILPSDRQDGIDERFSGNGSYEVIFTSTTNLLRFQQQAFNGSVTNISVKEITDDTNIPRINYEGFSYQDSLGSEEIVNGGFDTDSNWAKGSNWTISDGKANSDGSSNGQILQSNVFESNKTYKVTFTVTKVSGSGLIARAFYGSYETILSITESGTYTTNFTPNASTNGTLYFISSGLFVGSIDNVSVKEVVGQEEVPDSGCGSWLLEPQSTNLVPYSEDFSNSSWDKTQTTIEAANIAMPSGVINGYKLFANTSSTTHWIEVSPFPTATIGQDFTFSMFVKSSGSDFIQVTSSTGFPSVFQNFNISTGTKASGDISDSSIKDFGNGWYRISVTETTTGTNARYLIVPILSDVSRNATFEGNANEDGVYIYGAQLEQQSYATSYIPTNGATATRLADVCTSAGNASTFNDSEGVLMAEISYLKNKGTSSPFKVERISISDSSDTNRLFISNTTFANEIQVFVRNSVGISFNKIVTISDNTLYNKIVLKYKANDYSLWINGFELESDNTYNYLPSGLNVLKFEGASGAYDFEGKTKQLQYFDSALTDSELEELTSWSSFLEMANGQNYTIK